MCCGAVSKLLKQDKLGQASLAVVKVISGMVKGRNYNVKPQVQHLTVLKSSTVQTNSFASSVNDEQNKQTTFTLLGN